nr:hypothetical protein [Campylobacter sp. P093]
MQDNGFTLPIVKMDLKYINPIYFNEYFIVEISVIECDITLKFKYTLLSKDELTIAKASTTQVAVTLNKETLYSIPDDLKFALNQ